ncbi:MAG: hypothetical protein L3J65_11570, partial [Robiginitomaculum sp.]|nr:hypothetical protein [Robiginitomaculum sp.]
KGKKETNVIKGPIGPFITSFKHSVLVDFYAATWPDFTPPLTQQIAFDCDSLLSLQCVSRANIKNYSILWRNGVYEKGVLKGTIMSKKPSQVGLRQANKLIGMKYDKRIDFIAAGLPLILEHAQKLYSDGARLSDSPSSAQILINGAKEEAAKILILMDVVRCPKKRIARDIKSLMKWFYDHLSRLIYADCVYWKPQNVPELKTYIRNHRKTHYLDGNMGEYIFPNMPLYEREAQLYVDVAVLEIEDAVWVSPLHDKFTPSNQKPSSLILAEALSGFGLFAPKSLKIIAEIWNNVDFKGDEPIGRQSDWNEMQKQQIGYGESVALMKQLFQRIQAEKLCEVVNMQDHISSIFQHWQFPLYDFDLSPIIITHEELKDEQDAMQAQEIGY